MANKTNSDEKRLQLALALCRLLQAQEYSSISVHDIAREAGMNHGLIHYYFGSKDALLIEAIKISSDCQIALLDDLKHLARFFGAVPEIGGLCLRLEILQVGLGFLNTEGQAQFLDVLTQGDELIFCVF
jgi:AcrR family transcriptional regulator